VARPVYYFEFGEDIHGDVSGNVKTIEFELNYHGFVALNRRSDHQI
jgi:hypothetical protein